MYGESNVKLIMNIVCVYVDDIMMFGKDPQTSFDELTNIYNYKLKGVGTQHTCLGNKLICQENA